MFFEVVRSGLARHLPEHLAELQAQDTIVSRALKQRGRGIKTAERPVIEYAGPKLMPLQGPLPFGTLRTDGLHIVRA